MASMRRPLALIAMWLFVLLSPITAWWIVGDRSHKGDPDLDHMFEPLPLTSGQQVAIGATATILSLAALVVLGTAYQRGLVHRADVRVALPALLVGTYCGVGWRIVTAGVIGTNIGGALLVMFTPFFIVGMVVWFGLELNRFRANRPY